jgi:hypothetical protein
MLLKIDIVELGNIVFKFFLLHYLFNEVLTIVPSPGLVNLSEVLYNKVTLLNTSAIDANSSLAFSVNTKRCFIGG